MSGYFPARNWPNSQNLVDSTKIERLGVDSKKAHRKGKEKKEKRKDEKERHEKSHKSLRLNVKFDGKDKQLYPHSKKIQEESEQLEKSGLTEEHEQPQNLCYLSDGSQSNNKRKRQDPPSVDSHVKGKLPRIRFVFRKSNEPEAVVLREERVCSTSNCTQIGKDGRDANASCVTTAKTSKEEETIAITKRKKQKRSKESRYNALFEEWVPPPLCSAVLDVDDEDEDWLFSSRRQEPQSTAEDRDMSMNVVCWGDPLWPKAQSLPEVGIYALPYTIPF